MYTNDSPPHPTVEPLWGVRSAATEGASKPHSPRRGRQAEGDCERGEPFSRAFCREAQRPTGLLLSEMGRSEARPIGDQARPGGASATKWRRAKPSGRRRALIESRAEQLVNSFLSEFKETQIEVSNLEEVYSQKVDLIINTTTVGMGDGKAPVDLERFSQMAHVSDIIYNPEKTPFLLQAEGLNLPFINGLGMLLYQGCEAFEFWTGVSAPIDIMKKQLISHLASLN